MMKERKRVVVKKRCRVKGKTKKGKTDCFALPICIYMLLSVYYVYDEIINYICLRV